MKETAGIYRKWKPSVLVNQDNRIVLENKAKINIWEKYIGELFYDNRPLRETESDCLTGSSITNHPDGVSAEILKLLDGKRLISLMRHTLKIFLKILHQRLYRTCERDNRFTIWIPTRGWAHGTHTHPKLLRSEKRRVSVLHRLRKRLMQLLLMIYIDQKDIRCIENLY